MTATVHRTRLSGCARRRAKAIARRENVAAAEAKRIEWAEDQAFYENGTIPASSTGAAICSCGARAFTRETPADLSDFDAMHDQCDEVKK